MIQHEFILEIGQHITDLGLELSNDYVTHINAGTGLGKSTWVLENLSKDNNIIFAVPQRVQITQIQELYKSRCDISYVYGGVREKFSPNNLIVCTYDQLAFVIEQIAPEEYLLVVDEVHKTYQAASYRGDAIDNLISAINDELFTQVITMSATFTPELVPIELDAWINVFPNKEIIRNLEILTYDAVEAMEDQLLSISSTETEGITVIRINNKEKIAEYRALLEQQGLRCLAVYKDLQGGDKVQAMLTTESVSQYDIVLTTSLIDEAINICDTNIDSVHILGDRIHVEELKQFVGRFRNCNPAIKLHLYKANFGGEFKDIQDSKDELLDIANAAQILANKMVGRKKMSLGRITAQVNTTVENLCGFKPLRVADWQGCKSIVVNHPGVSAGLYAVDLDNHYTDLTAFEDELLSMFPDSSIFYRHISGKGDPENDALFRTAKELLGKEKEELLKACMKEAIQIANKIPEDDALADAITYLSDTNDGDTPKGMVFRSWDTLTRTVLPNPFQSFEVIQKGNEKDVWAFWKAAERDILVQSVLAKLSQCTERTLFTLDEARKLFLACYREIAKEYPEFKAMVKEINNNNVSVKPNNHFAVSDSYIRHVFKCYTATPPKKSNNKWKLIFDGIGPYGYDYSLPNFDRFINPNKSRRAARFEYVRRSKKSA